MYCTSLYCCQLWFNSIKSSLKKLSTSYNSVLRRLLGICKPYSVSKMFVFRGIPTFAELLRKSIYRFAQRIEHSLNCGICATLSPLLYISSPIRKWLYSLCKIVQCNACLYLLLVTCFIDCHLFLIFLTCL